ncbi:unnamed protein product [Pedinophyceae sp. YPF-701]|nr:unnamed protein product [Pedinophyceae sp. YPF-701]
MLRQAAVRAARALPASRDAAWQQLAFPGLREHVEKLIGDNFKKTYGLDQAKLFKLVAEASSKEEATEALNTIHRAWVWRTAAPRGSLRRWHNALGFEFVDKCIGIGASGVALDAARRAWEVGFVVRAPLFHRVMEAMIEEGDVAGLIMTYAAMKDNVVAPTQATGAILVGGLRGAGREELAAAVEEEFKLNGVPIAGADA